MVGNCRGYQYKEVASGSIVGRLTVSHICGKSKQGNFWFCHCECGNTVEVLASSLNSGLKQSCGCLAAEPKTIKHGMSKTPTYNSWFAMKSRCNNPKNEYYHLYGGRGISYTKEWDDFESFLKDMGERPEGHTLDRVDVNRDYSKENCRWADSKTQARNTRKQLAEGCGVYWRGDHQRWCTSIGVDGKLVHLGSFKTREEAQAVRKRAEEELWKN